jgi:hypothetical protein
MNKHIVDKLILRSYKDNYLDEKTVNKIASLLNKQDLKTYINGLKLEEMKKCLIVSSPVDNQNLDEFRKLFPNKKIVLKKDTSLMLGVRVIDNDIVHEFTLKSSFDKILNYIEHNYD